VTDAGSAVATPAMDAIDEARRRRDRWLELWMPIRRTLRRDYAVKVVPDVMIRTTAAVLALDELGLPITTTTAAYVAADRPPTEGDVVGMLYKLHTLADHGVLVRVRRLYTEQGRRGIRYRWVVRPEFYRALRRRIDELAGGRRP